jgi:molecular chaperone DnaK (HSP70)
VTASRDEWLLAIDFGTSNTVAVVKDAPELRAVEFELGQPFFPSVVFSQQGGTLISGVAAFNNRLLQPRRYF